MKITVFILSAFFLITGCKKEDQHLPPDFNYKIPTVDITENVNVGAYYYNYSASDWNKGYSDTPSIGEYNGIDASVMTKQQNWADEGGIDFFIFNWDGSSAGDPLINSFITGRNNAVKMVINYNTSHLKASNSSPLAGSKLTTMINEFKDLAATHFDKDYYYTIDGKPVVLITPLNLTSSKSSSIDFGTVIPQLRQALDSMSVNLYIIGEITSGWLPPQRYSSAIQVMDAVDLSDWSTAVYDQSVFTLSFSDISWKNWTDSTTNWGVDYIPCIFPGFNDKVTTPKSKKYNIDRTEQFYTDYCNVAKRNMGKNRIVLINSWNNFQLGTEIEPSVEYGDTYLKITKDQFKIK